MFVNVSEDLSRGYPCGVEDKFIALCLWTSYPLLLSIALVELYSRGK